MKAKSNYSLLKQIGLQKMNSGGIPISETNRSKAIACQIKRISWLSPRLQILKFLEKEKHKKERKLLV